MRRRYSLAAKARHGLYFLIRFLPVSKLKHRLCVGILKKRNSLPLYLGVYPGDSAVQVGTPNFVTLVRLSKLVGPAGKVVIIEADPSNARKLELSAKEKDIRNVKIIGKGAWSFKGKIDLEKSDDFDGDHKVTVPGVFIDNDFRTEYTEKVTIDVDTVDNIMSELGLSEINYLSITVNGAEHEVLKGCPNILRNSPNIKVFSKGHARIGSPESGQPLNVPISNLLLDVGFKTIVTQGEKSTANIDSWKTRDGDVFGWKTPSMLIGPR